MSVSMLYCSGCGRQLGGGDGLDEVTPVSFSISVELEFPDPRRNTYNILNMKLCVSCAEDLAAEFKTMIRGRFHAS